MQPQTEAERGGGGAETVDALREGGRRLTPEQLYVGPARGDRLGRRGGPAEVEGDGVLEGRIVELGTLDAQVLPVRSTRLPARRSRRTAITSSVRA